MQVNVQLRPAYSIGILGLAPGEQIRAESGAMVSMTYGVQVQTQATGGFFKSIGRMVAGESFFQTIFSAPPNGGEIVVAPALPGDIHVLEVHGEEMLIQSGSYLASEMGVNVDAKWGGAKSFFGGEGLIMLRTSGGGKVVISSYGAIVERNLAPGEVYTVDTGHLVAFPAQMPFNVRAVGGLKATVFSGEGLVCDLTGPGRLFMQTRSFNAFLSFLKPYLPSSGG
jgi:uncharacterized protein (TIGR00266 family)